MIAVLVCAAACSHDVASPAVAPPDAFDAGWHGEKVCERLFENEFLRTARCTFPPGVGHERHTHKPHWGIIVEGSTMRTTDANGVVERELKSGSTWWSDGIAWHEALNIGETTGVYIIIEPKQAQTPAPPF